jgi:hypothetical protein
MDTKTFLENFGTIAEAPGGIDRLRELVRDLAVHGGLGTSESHSGVHKSKNEWEKTTLGGVIHSIRVSAKIDQLETYELWSVPSFADGDPERVLGSTIGSGKLSVAPSDVLISKINPRLNRVWIVDEPRGGLEQIASTEWLVARVSDTSKLSPKYLSLFASAPTFRQFISIGTQGTTGSHTRAKTPRILKAPIEIPPLAEQKRIVAKVDELMALCDELEEKQQRKATVTTKLRGSSFNALRQAETPSDLAAAWERISTNWSHLTNHPDSIPELRQTILELAVRGRLVEGNLEAWREFRGSKIIKTSCRNARRCCASWKA